MRAIKFHTSLLFLLLFVAGLCAPGLAPAQDIDTAKTRKAEELFALIHMEDTYNLLLAQVTQQTDQMGKGLFPEGPATEAQKQLAADFKDKVEAMVHATFSWQAMKPEYLKLYTDTYSESELDGIIAFYRSPVGQKMLNATPALMKASSAIAMGHMESVEPKLRDLMDEYQKRVLSDERPGKKSQ